MKKYFICSDTHSFYTALKNSLDQAGYDINNKDHIFILNGDMFDRGEESVQILEFVRSIPKERRILIRGNHEYLLKSLLRKEYPQQHDYSNGTVFTVYQLYNSRHPESNIFKGYEKYKEEQSEYDYYDNDWIEVQKFNDYFYYAFNEDEWKMICEDILSSGLIDWIFGDEWVDYYELGNFIITHSFIPLYKVYGTYSDLIRYEPEWRTCATRKEWNDATWDCPYSLFDDGYFNKEIENGKILVCGHWHASDFHWHYEGTKDKNHNIYMGDNLIAIDSCTVLSNFVNILVIDEDFKCYDRFGKLMTKRRSKTFKGKSEV